MSLPPDPEREPVPARAGEAGQVQVSPPAPARESPPPLEANDRLVTAVITAGWAIALVVLLLVRSDIRPAERWWIWTAVAGLGLGLFGLAYEPHLKRARERAALRRSSRQDQGRQP